MGRLPRACDRRGASDKCHTYPMIYRLLNLLFLVLFLLAAAVQYNDPDWYIWMPMYLAPALASFLALRGRLPAWWPGLVLVVAAVWAALIGRHVIGKIGFRDLFQEISMANPSIEYGREFYGLLIVATWMLVLTLASRGRASAA